MSLHAPSTTIPVFVGVLAFLDGCSSTPAATADDTSGGAETQSSTSSTAESATAAESDSEASGSAGTTSSAEESSGSADSTGPLDPECGTSTCGAPAPEGWSGPSIYTRVAPGEALPPCPVEAPSPGLTWLDGFVDPGPAVCGCACDGPPSDCYAYVYTHAFEGCDQYADYSMLVDECINLEIPGFIEFSPYGIYSGGACQPMLNEQIPPPGWNAQIRTCELPENPMACMEGGVCLPAPPRGFEATWCLSRVGDESCPAGPYSEKHLFYTGVDDDRGCSNCTCGSADVDCTAATLEVYAEPDCAGEPSVILQDTECSAVVGESFLRIDPDVSCAVVDGPEPGGSVTPVGEVTFCCQPAT